MVVAGHAYVLSGRGAVEPLAVHAGLSLGELGVSIFFVISGFLIAMSLERVGALSTYLANRCLRILPGLAVALALTAFVLGPLVTRLPASAYFSAPQTWAYVARNLVLYPVTYRLPGVFEHTPYPEAVNGSLWTLRLEFSLYLLLPALAAARLAGRRGLAAVAGLAALAFVAAVALGPRAPAVGLIGARNAYLFLAGSALYAWREALWLRSWVALAAAAGFALAMAPLRLFAPGLELVLPLIVVGLGLRPAPGLRSAARFGDFSYGIYIYAFPLQQALMQAFGPARLPIPVFLLASLACAVPLAAFSWWCVERPALSLKRRSAASGEGARPAPPPGSPRPPGGAAAPAAPPA
jgi:peptidoglycan/LPS O-acetylase OafA/YrhL